jgi:hypothetical protein
MSNENEKVVPLKEVQNEEPASEKLSIAKPSGFSLDKFKSKRGGMAGVETLQSALPVQRMSEAKDFVRLHSDEDEWWSPELCFVNVPIKGQARDTLHLIDEELAVEFLSPKQIQRFRLALATKPYDVFFFCQVSTQNLDNSWVASNLMACEQAKTSWVMAASQKDVGIDSYKVIYARHQDAFAVPKWPTEPLITLIERTFAGRTIDDENHPGLLRLTGARQSVT